MRDRLSTKILSNGATRYGVYDETGNLLRYEYIKLEDEPTVDGDLFSKANMLPDSIPAALGLKMGNPQVKDALNVLANIGNVHVWQRVQTYADPVPEVPAGYTLGEVEENVLLVRSGNENETRFSVLIYYADSVSVSLNGDVTMSMTSAKWVNCAIINDTGNPPLIAGKFIMATDTGNTVSKHIELNQIFYVPSDANWNGEANSVGNYDSFISKLQRVTGYPYTPAIPAGTHVDYLTSTDPNAYPKQSAEGGQDAYYSLGDVVSGTIVPVNTGQVQFKYSTTVTVYDNGDLNVDGDVVNLQNYNTEGTSTIKGKYIVPVTTGASISGVWFIPSDATFSLISVDGNATKRYLYCDKMQPVTGYPAIPADTVITYLGQLGAGRMQRLSYVGTGVYGEENKNSLTFDFNVNAVLIFVDYDYNGFSPYGFCKPQEAFVVTTTSRSTDTAGRNSIQWDGETVSWWFKESVNFVSANDEKIQVQLNISGITYTCIGFS